MKTELDSTGIDIPCPHCGKKLNERIGRLNHNQDITCPWRRKTFRADADELRRATDSFQKAKDAFGRTLGKISK